MLNETCTQHQGRKLFRLSLSVLLMLITGLSSAQSTAKKADLKEANQAESKTLQSLPENTKLTITQRLGFWVKVKVNNTAGWLRLSDVHFAEAGNARVNLSSLELGRTGKNNIVSASAARGLSANQLQEAPADFSAVERLVSLSRNEELLLKFRNEGGLQVKSFSPLTIAQTAAAKVEQSDTSQKNGNATNSKPKAKNEDW